MSLFRTILVAADLSERSRAAFRLACSLAHETKTRVFVVYVLEQMPIVEEPVAFGEMGLPIHVGRAGHEHHDALKARLRELYTPARPIDVTYLVRDGGAADELLRAADEIGCDLIALGTHGRTGLRRLLTGSVAEAVLRRAHCPVMALRDSESPAPAAAGETILVPTDFSPRSDSAIAVARSLARDRGARLIVMHVAPIDVLKGGQCPIPVDLAPYRESLESVARQLDGPDLKVRVETQLRQGDPVTEILDAVQAAGCSLVVMGTHGRTGVGRLLVGSVAEAVLRRASCPVLAIKEAGPVAAKVPARGDAVVHGHTH